MIVIINKRFSELKKPSYEYNNVIWSSRVNAKEPLLKLVMTGYDDWYIDRIFKDDNKEVSGEFNWLDEEYGILTLFPNAQLTKDLNYGLFIGAEYFKYKILTPELVLYEAESKIQNSHSIMVLVKEGAIIEEYCCKNNPIPIKYRFDGESFVTTEPIPEKKIIVVSTGGMNQEYFTKYLTNYSSQFKEKDITYFANIDSYRDITLEDLKEFKIIIGNIPLKLVSQLSKDQIYYAIEVSEEGTNVQMPDGELIDLCFNIVRYSVKKIEERGIENE